MNTIKLNIKYKISALWIVSIFLMILTSCSDFLNVEPDSDLVEEEFWTKREDIESVLAASYDALRETTVPSLIWGELRADMIEIGGSGSEEYQSISEVEIKSTFGVINWKSYYNTINLANTVLFYMPRVQEVDQTLTDEIRNGLEAEAIFLRSLCYFYLVRIWKDAPLVLSPSVSDTVDLFLPKSSEHEIINQIIGDLEQAKDKAFTDELRYPAEGGTSEKYFRGRANKYAILSLLADIYLWNEQYQKCVDACDAVINSNVYSLIPQIDWFTMYYPGNCQESIFELQYDHSLDQYNPIYDDMIKITSGSKLAFSGDKYFTNDDDIRLCTRRTPTWKYTGRSQDFVTARQPVERDGNMIYYRLADIHLLKAEALTELNDPIQASEEVSKVVSIRTGQSFTTIIEKSTLQQAVLNERAREFAVEGKHWFDVLRFAKRNHFENKQVILNMVIEGADAKDRPILRSRLLDTMSYYLPIPENDILYNQNLEQNPYYDR
ncbi:MAG: RagB/SusD family nutrient uptake outer membrane protein [Bacteroidales bacterium]|nr:RagB/SusD family nutrient uptake outer membrane protein [Bacteroidales bacterium]